MKDNFEWLWEHNQGASFLKEENSSLKWKKSLAEYFYRAGKASEHKKLEIATEALKDIRNNNRFCDTNHSNTADDALIEIEEIENE